MLSTEKFALNIWAVSEAIGDIRARKLQSSVVPRVIGVRGRVISVEDGVLRIRCKTQSVEHRAIRVQHRILSEEYRAICRLSGESSVEH